MCWNMLKPRHKDLSPLHRMAPRLIAVVAISDARAALHALRKAMDGQVLWKPSTFGDCSTCGAEFDSDIFEHVGMSGWRLVELVSLYPGQRRLREARFQKSYPVLLRVPRYPLGNHWQVLQRDWKIKWLSWILEPLKRSFMRKLILHHSHGSVGILFCRKDTLLASKSSRGNVFFDVFCLCAGQKSPESSKVSFPVMPTCFCMFYRVWESVSHQVIIGTLTSSTPGKGWSINLVRVSRPQTRSNRHACAYDVSAWIYYITFCSVK